MAKFLKFPILSHQTEEQINFDSFTKFSMYLYRFVPLDFQGSKVNPSWREKFLFFVKVNYIKFFFFGYFLAWLSIITLAATSESFLDGSKAFLDIIAYMHVVCKVLNAYSCKDRIGKLLQEMRPLFDRRNNQNRHYGIKKYLDNFNILLMVYTGSIITLLLPVVFPIIPYLLFGKMDLASEFWFPFDPFQVVIYPFVYLWANWTSISGLYFMLASETLFYGVITVLIMEFDILRADLADLINIANLEKQKQLNSLIDRHNKLLELSDKFQDIYSYTFFGSFVTNSIIMCLIVFILSVTSGNISTYVYYSSYLVVGSTQALLLCMFGQKLIDSSESLSKASYFSGWEELEDRNFKRTIILVILRAQKAKRLSAMGFANISLETFTAVSFHKN